MIDDKRLISIHSVKYLRVLLDEHMSWNEQIYQIKLKLNRSIGILSKLCSHVNLNTLRIAYYSLFQYHLMAMGWGVVGCDRLPLLKFVPLFQKAKSKNNEKLAKTK